MIFVKSSGVLRDQLYLIYTYLHPGSYHEYLFCLKSNLFTEIHANYAKFEK